MNGASGLVQERTACIQVLGLAVTPGARQGECVDLACVLVRLQFNTWSESVPNDPDAFFDFGCYDLEFDAIHAVARHPRQVRIAKMFGGRRVPDRLAHRCGFLHWLAPRDILRLRLEVWCVEQKVRTEDSADYCATLCSNSSI